MLSQSDDHLLEEGLLAERDISREQNDSETSGDDDLFDEDYPLHGVPTFANILHAPSKWAKVECDDTYQNIASYFKNVAILVGTSLPRGLISSRAVNEFHIQNDVLHKLTKTGITMLGSIPLHITINHSLSKLYSHFNDSHHKLQFTLFALVYGTLTTIHFVSYCESTYEQDFVVKVSPEVAWPMILATTYPITIFSNSFFSFQTVHDYKNSYFGQLVLDAYYKYFGTERQQKRRFYQHEVSKILRKIKRSIPHLSRSKIDQLHDFLCKLKPLSHRDKSAHELNSLNQIITLLRDDIRQQDLSLDKLNLAIDIFSQIMGITLSLFQSVPAWKGSQYGINRILDAIAVEDTTARNAFYYSVAPFPVGSSFLTGLLYCTLTVKHSLLAIKDCRMTLDHLWVIPVAMFLGVAPSLSSFVMSISGDSIGASDLTLFIGVLSFLASFASRVPILIENFMHYADGRFINKIESQDRINVSEYQLTRYYNLKRVDIAERINKTNLEVRKLKSRDVFCLHKNITKHLRYS